MEVNKINPLDHIMDVQEAAELWGFALSTTKDLCRIKLEAQGTAVKKGRTWILDKHQGKQEFNPLDHIIDVQEASELWGLAPSTIKDLCRNKLEAQGLAVKKGKTWILDKNQENPKKYKNSSY